jgi:hypothetical protein
MMTESCSSLKTGLAEIAHEIHTRVEDSSPFIPATHIMRHGQDPPLIFVVLQT